MTLKLKIKSRSRGFGNAMSTEAASDLVQRLIDGGINAKLHYRTPNPKRAGSAARERYSRYMKSTTLQQYIDATNNADGEWPPEARRDLIFDLSKGLVTINDDSNAK